MGTITKWTDVWKPPFELSVAGSKVFDSNGRMVFDFVIPLLAKSYDYNIWIFGPGPKELIIGILNGTETRNNKMGTFQIPQEDPDWIYYTPKEGSENENQSKRVILIRGWGYLTGQGGLNLDPELAGNLQNQLREWICTRLNE